MSPQTTTGTNAGPQGKPRVVIIDDTADLRDLLRLALQRGGLEVVGEAADGRAGIDLVRETLPDLVLLDLSMPVLDGMTALPEIRALVPAAKIVVLSGFDALQLAERAVAAGADAYLQKGMPLHRMLARIREVMEGRAAPAAPSPGTVPPARYDALALAPFGVLEVDGIPPYRVISLNASARDLLPAGTGPGTPLPVASPALAELLATSTRLDDGPFDARIGEQDSQVTVRSTPGSHYLYFEPRGDEVGVLRTAIATTAHEIRGPVAVLSALAETISEASSEVPLDDEQQLRLVASIARQARMLDSITSDLLTAAQIQRGALRVAPTITDPRSVVETTVDDRHLDRTVRLEVMDIRKVVADPLRLGQMLGNLLGNAHKYGRPPVVVRIRAAGEDGMVAIDVEDAGDGVPSEFRDQLFREFTRASGTSAAGTGLGLHVVQTLALAQDGRVDYTAADGGGSVFTITLPAAD